MKEVRIDKAYPRLDKCLSELWPEYSRSQLQNWIAEGRVKLNGQVSKAAQRLVTGDLLSLDESLNAESIKLEPQPMDLDIIYEDEDLLVLNKPRNLVVHPAAGHSQDTLVNGLLAYLGRDNLSNLNGDFRPGIVHRLDKDTTGLLLVTKNNQMHRSMSKLLFERKIERQYRALVWGKPKTQSGIIDAPIGRSLHDRKKMAVRVGGKEARTSFEVLEQYKKGCELKLTLESGRTHQIRVHLRFINCFIVGDPVYGGKFPRLDLSGQALHAYRLAFTDPRDGKYKSFSVDPPLDYLKAQKQVRQMV